MSHPKKNIKIKAWPEITGYLPSLIPYSSLNSKSNFGRNFFLDLDSCLSIDSSGLNIFLIQLLKLSNSLGAKRAWEFSPKNITPAISKAQRIGLFDKLSLYSQSNALFSIQDFVQGEVGVCIEEVSSGEIQTSLPIFSIKIPSEVGTDRRKQTLNKIRQWFYNNLFHLSEQYDFNLINLNDVINEIAKNTADHTTSDLFIGVDIIEDKNKEYLKIKLSAGDTGQGINKSIKKASEGTEWQRKAKAKRIEYWDLTQTYKWALQRGNTTKFSSLQNKGIGMASIMVSSAKTPMRLLVFDAKSCGTLSNLDPDRLSHASVRKEFNSIDKPVGFYYYGEIFAKKRYL